MKNIIKGALLLLLAGGVAACNLNKYPSNAIPADEGFTTFKDAKEFRNSIYYMGRSSMTDIISANMQCEGINATLDYGNSYGEQYAWTFTDTDSTVDNIWTNDNGNISQINYFLEQCETLIANDANLSESDPDKMSAQDLKDLNLYIGEAHFFRALLRRHLVMYYCKDYEPTTADTDWGIILNDTYNIAQRLPRATMAKTYEAINADLDLARTAIEGYYGGGDPAEKYYLGSTAVKCLTAYVQLDMHQYPEAAATAASIADASRYALITDATSFASMWKNNEGSELIFQFFASLDEGSVQYGSPFLYDPFGDPDHSTSLKPQYVPAQYMIDQYSNNGNDAWVDIRPSAYFTTRTCRIGTASVNLKLLNKYPGNPNYNATAGLNSLANNVPLYRSADFVLLAAEAYYRAGDEVNANKYLQKLREARIHANSSSAPEYTYTPYSGEELFSEIKMERLKEMFMESNRMADLKRWGDPMSRLGWTPQDESVCVTIGMYLNINANDYRFVWPIPQSEYTNNSAIKDQLNWK